MDKIKRAIGNLLSLILAAAMCVSLLPVSSVTALAADGDTNTVTLEDCENGSLSFDGYAGQTHRFAEGEEVTVNLGPDDGYAATTFTVTADDTGEEVSQEVQEDDVGFTFVVPNGDITVSAKFEPVEGEPVEGAYIVTLGICAHGSLSFEGSDELAKSFLPGDDVVINIDPDEEYEAVAVTVIIDETGQKVSAEAGPDTHGFKFIMPECDVTAGAEFEGGTGETHSVAVSGSEGVSVTLVDENGDPVDKTEYEEGDIVYVNATAEEGYELTDGITFDINDTVIDADERIGDLTVAFGMPDDDVDVEAEAETENMDEENQGSGMLQFFSSAATKSYSLSDDWSMTLYMSGNSWSKLGVSVAYVSGPEFRIRVSNVPSTGSFTWSAKQQYLGYTTHPSGVTTRASKWDSVEASGTNPCTVTPNKVTNNNKWEKKLNVYGTYKSGTSVSNATVSERTSTGGSSSDDGSDDTGSGDDGGGSGGGGSGGGSASTASTKGYLTLKLSSSQSGWTSDSAYSLKGAVYKVYTDSSCSSQAKDTNGDKAVLTVKADGTTNKLTMKAGTYYVKQTTAAAGHKKDSEAHKAKVTAGSTATVSATVKVDPAYLTLTMSSDRPDWVADSSSYALEGAVYKVYTDPDCSSQAKDADGNKAALTVKADGTTNKLEMKAGTYYVKQSTAAPGHDTDADAHKASVSAGDTTTVKTTVTATPASISVSLSPAQDGWEENENYSLEGTVYTVYTDPECTEVAVDADGEEAVLTAGADGTTNTVEMEAGDYYIRQTEASSGYEADTEVYEASAGTDAGTAIEAAATAIPAYLTVSISSADAGLSAGNACYSLEGAEYTVYSDAECTQVQTDADGRPAVFTTDADGSSVTLAVPAGTLYVKETRNSEGYMLCGGGCSCAGSEDGVHAVTLTQEASEESPAILRCATVPAHDPEGLTVYKTDADTGESLAQGNADLAGAQFTVGYYAGYYDGEELPESPDRVWVVETEHNEAEGVYEAKLTDGYRVSGDSLYLYDGRETLPLGTYTLQETLAPEGYLLEGAPVVSLNWVSEHTYEAPVHVGHVTLEENEVQGLTFGGGEESGDVRSEEEAEGIAEIADTEPEEDVQDIDAGEDAEDAGTSADAEDGEDVEEEYAEAAGSGGEALSWTNRYTAEENVKRFDFILETQDDGTHDDTGYTEFEITSLTTGESHRFLTDASGEYVSVASTNPHTYDTDNATDQHSGLWFYGTADAGTQEAETVVDSEGALPYDVYSVDEIAGANNSGRDLYHAVFGFTDDDYSGSVYMLTASDGYTETEEEEDEGSDDSAAVTAASDAGDSGTDGTDSGTDGTDSGTDTADAGSSSAQDTDPGTSGGSEAESGASTVQTGASGAGAAAGLAGVIALAAAAMLAYRRRKAA